MYGIFVMQESTGRGLVVGYSSKTNGAVLSDDTWANEMKHVCISNFCNSSYHISVLDISYD